MLLRECIIASWGSGEWGGGLPEYVSLVLTEQTESQLKWKIEHREEAEL